MISGDIELHIIAPGLCGPLAETGSLASDHVFRQWCAVLSRAERLPAASSLHATLATLFSLSHDGDLPAAALAVLAEQGDTDAGHFLFADPVYLQADLDHAVLSSIDDIDITPPELQSLYESLNTHFERDGITFIQLAGGQWVARSREAMALQTTPLHEAIGRNVNFILPTGEQAPRWNKVLTEAQMLLHAHPVNVERESLGKLPVNSLWLHGAGDLPVARELPAMQVSSDHNLIKGLAMLHRCEAVPLPDSVEAYVRKVCSSEHRRFVLYLDDLQQLVNYTDVSLWRDGLAELLDSFLYPLLKSVKRKNIDVKLYPCNGSLYRISRYDHLKFWRSNDPGKHVSSY